MNSVLGGCKSASPIGKEWSGPLVGQERAAVRQEWLMPDPSINQALLIPLLPGIQPTLRKPFNCKTKKLNTGNHALRDTHFHKNCCESKSGLMSCRACEILVLTEVASRRQYPYQQHLAQQYPVQDLPFPVQKFDKCSQSAVCAPAWLIDDHCPFCRMLVALEVSPLLTVLGL